MIFPGANIRFGLSSRSSVDLNSDDIRFWSQQNDCDDDSPTVKSALPHVPQGATHSRWTGKYQFKGLYLRWTFHTISTTYWNCVIWPNLFFKVAYYGSPHDVTRHFSSMGLHCPLLYNPADFISMSFERYPIHTWQIIETIFFIQSEGGYPKMFLIIYFLVYNINELEILSIIISDF